MTPNQITFITALDKTEKQGRAFWPLLLARLEEGVCPEWRLGLS